MPQKKQSAQDAMKKWATADKKQRRVWHWKNRIKAAEVRNESEEFINGLKADRDKELADL